jgi:hypothetical protein
MNYVVLATKKEHAPAKGKDRDIEKWEAEVRRNIAGKKAIGTANLSKQDKALVDAQLRAESEVRKNIDILKAKAERGFGLIRSAIASQTSDFEVHGSSILSLLLESALRHGTPLVGSLALTTYFVSFEAAGVHPAKSN